jgi:arylsulfatase A
VLQPVASRGLHPDEATIAEVLRQRGYATACIGKWHLGDQLPFLPTNQGFDEFYGIPYSEDMVNDKRPNEWPPLPLMRGTEVIEAPVDCEKLTRIYTEAAVDFIRRSKDKPFFLYFPEARPGSTRVVHVGDEFRGKSANGLYGDSVEELDWSLGKVLDAVKEQGLDERTIVVWTSDNGAVRRDPPQGSNAPYQGMGYGTSEGGMRMPCLIRWPGHIPAGRVCEEVCTSLDFLPTFAAIAGATPDPARRLDGFDARDLWLGKPDAKSRYDESGFFFYHMSQLQAIRRGPWKLYLPLETALTLGAKKLPAQTMRLFDVRSDFREEREASADHPEVVRSLLALADQARDDLGDLDRPGKGQRAAGHVDHPTRRVKK